MLGDVHPDTLHSANDLAVNLSTLGRSEEALELHQDTYNRRRRVLGEDHPDTLTSAANLAANLQGLGLRKAAFQVKGQRPKERANSRKPKKRKKRK